ncbi:MAG: Gfo/Idh/MocA family oxidoreductase [bacterium]|nr:Gfo/Idh/MocA family oxidoreductase [bacterium]
MNQSELRAAVVGFGNMGRHHARVYHELPGVSLVALCDADLATVTNYSAQFGTTTYTDLTEMLAKESIDIVTLAAPTSLHFVLGKQLLEAGCHVLVEKPIAASIEDADALSALAESKGVVLAVGHIERFNPAVIALKDVVESGRLGDVRSLVLRRCGPMPPQIKDANVIIDLAVHDIDIATMLVGTSPVSVAAHAGRSQLSDRHDHAEILLTYPSASAMIQVNWITPKRVRNLTLTGSNGYAELDFIAKTVDVFIGTDEAEPIEVADEEALKTELKHFIAAVKGQETLEISSAVGRDALASALDVLAVV